MGGVTGFVSFCIQKCKVNAVVVVSGCPLSISIRPKYQFKLYTDLYCLLMNQLWTDLDQLLFRKAEAKHVHGLFLLLPLLSIELSVGGREPSVRKALP